jgi:inner membrane protein
MASIFSHAVAAVAIGSAFPAPRSRRFWIYGAICSAIPDLDVTGFGFNINYEDLWGHRGLTHSIAFAAALAIAAATMMRRVERTQRWQMLWLYFFLATVSHGILDAFTNGGLGVAFFAPFVNERYFFPVQPIEVSPIGVHSFFSMRGLRIIQNEFVWIWIPSLLFALGTMALRFRMGKRSTARAEMIRR